MRRADSRTFGLFLGIAILLSSACASDGRWIWEPLFDGPPPPVHIYMNPAEARRGYGFRSVHVGETFEIRVQVRLNVDRSSARFLARADRMKTILWIPKDLRVAEGGWRPAQAPLPRNPEASWAYRPDSVPYEYELSLADRPGKMLYGYEFSSAEPSKRPMKALGEEVDLPGVSLYVTARPSNGRLDIPADVLLLKGQKVLFDSSRTGYLHPLKINCAEAEEDAQAD